MKRRKRKVIPWSKAAERELFNGVGISGIAWFQKRCGKRTRAAVYKKLLREYGAGGFTRGVYTLRELERTTGYDENQIQRAGSALNQKWKRLGPRGAHLITEEQLREIVTWLGHDFWSKPHRLYCCTWCNATRRSHRAAGLCAKCYHAHRRLCKKLGLPASLKAQVAFLKRGATIGDNDPQEARARSQSLSRLSSGLALSVEQLDWLVMLA